MLYFFDQPKVNVKVQFTKDTAFAYQKFLFLVRVSTKFPAPVKFSQIQIAFNDSNYSTQIDSDTRILQEEKKRKKEKEKKEKKKSKKKKVWLHNLIFDTQKNLIIISKISKPQSYDLMVKESLFKRKNRKFSKFLLWENKKQIWRAFP
jgi:hypothetical protein